MDVRVVGASRDRLETSSRMAARLELPFPLLADAEGELAAAYGAKGFLGTARRVTFVVDDQGRISRVYDKVSPSAHAAQLLKDLSAG